MEKTQALYLNHRSNRLGLLLLFTLVFNLTFQSIKSQEVSETGLPYIQNYSPNDYGAFDQNWDTVQDSLGVLYFANGDGILSYDGVTWDLFELPNKASVFSLAITDKDIIYAGAGNELGYLEPDSQGNLRYISLMTKLPQKYHDFGQIMSVISNNDGIFFGSKEYIFKWDGSNFEAWENSDDSFIYFVHNKLLKRRDQGLMEFKNNTFDLVPKGEFFADKKIYAILPV